LSLVIYKSPLPEIEQETDNDNSASLGTLAFPQLVLAAVTLFFMSVLKLLLEILSVFSVKILGLLIIRN
jgi:hypothetical protein